MKSEAGNTIPIVLVTSSDASTGIQGISYDILKSDMRKSIRDLKEKIKTVNVLGDVDLEKRKQEELNASSANSGNSGLLSETAVWTNSEGTEVKAAIRKVDDGKVEFVMPDGRLLLYPLSSLSGESQAKIGDLQKSAQ